MSDILSFWNKYFLQRSVIKWTFELFSVIIVTICLHAIFKMKESCISHYILLTIHEWHEFCSVVWMFPLAYL